MDWPRYIGGPRGPDLGWLGLHIGPLPLDLFHMIWRMMGQSELPHDRKRGVFQAGK